MSEWTSLPSDTTELDLEEVPTQDQLVQIASRFTCLRSLRLCPGEEPPGDPELDFAAEGVRFPELRELVVEWVGLKGMVFTEDNTPKLEKLNVGCIPGHVSPFRLALPHLTSFGAEHTMLAEDEDGIGQFGLSLSRCPKLEQVITYKFRCLGDINFCVLPNMKEITLHRSECTRALDILYAPKLESVSLQAAYELDGFMLRNLPQATVSTVEALLAATKDARNKAREKALEVDRHWRVKSQERTLEARERNWIEDDQEWEVQSQPDADDSDDSAQHLAWGIHDEILAEHTSSVFSKEFSRLRKEMWGALLGASVEDSALPSCTVLQQRQNLELKWILEVDVTNMGGGFRKGKLEAAVRGRVIIEKTPARDVYGMDMDSDSDSGDSSDDDMSQGSSW